jgi:hypothetical protein
VKNGESLGESLSDPAADMLTKQLPIKSVHFWKVDYILDYSRAKYKSGAADDSQRVPHVVALDGPT